MGVRGLGCPVRFTLTAGQKGDAPQAAALIDGLPAEVVMADTAYDADPAPSHRRQRGDRRHPQQPVTSAQISARQASLRPAPPRGVLFSQNSSNSAVLQPASKRRTQLPRSRNSRSHHLMDPISVHTTPPRRQPLGLCRHPRITRQECSVKSCAAALKTIPVTLSAIYVLDPAPTRQTTVRSF